MFRRTITAFVTILLLATLCLAGDIKLAWNANTETDLAGYKVYYGMATGVYGSPQTALVSASPTLTLTGLAPGTYYIAVTAYNTAGLESGYSNEVVGVVYAAPVPAPVDPLGLGVILTTDTTKTTATVAWNTTVPSDGVIQYGLTEQMTTTKVVDTGMVTNHIAKLTGLTGAHTYYFRASSKDSSGATVTSATGTFITK